MKNAPCKGCTERTADPYKNINCHSYCKRYLEWLQEVEKESQNKSKDREIFGYGRTKSNRLLGILKGHGVKF